MKKLALAAVAVALVACAPQAPPNLRPMVPTAHQIVIPITPHCDFGQFSDWTLTPPVGQVPPVAWYTAITQGGPHPALSLTAGVPATVVLPSGEGPWQLFMLTSDTTWAPVSNIVVNPAPRCV